MTIPGLEQAEAAAPEALLGTAAASSCGDLSTGWGSQHGQLHGLRCYRKCLSHPESYRTPAIHALRTLQFLAPQSQILNLYYL